MTKHSTIAYILFFTSLSLLLSLGGWQWQRGVEKAGIDIAQQRASDQYIMLDRAPPNWSDLAYRRVRLQGEWLEAPIFLMANRTHRGRQGYEVFNPFRLSGDHATLLVNRGWVENAEALSGALREHTEPNGQLYLPKKGFTLGAAISAQPPDQSITQKTIQYFDASALSAALGSTLQPAALAIEAQHPAAFTPIWQAYYMTATRHYGYAAQWWGLALTLIVFGMIWRRQSRIQSLKPTEHTQ